MIITTRIRHLLLALVALNLLAVISARAAEQCEHCPYAHDSACDDRNDRNEHDRRGLVVGFNLGGSNANLDFNRLGAKMEREIEGGTGGAMRIGYGISDEFVIGFEVFVAEKEDSAVEMEAGAALVTATWFPGGGGFFLRAGVGTGVTTLKMTSPENIDWVEREGDAGLFGFGYEWRLGNKFALGVAADGVMTEHSDTLGFQDTEFGFGSASLQLNWYL